MRAFRPRRERGEPRRQASREPSPHPPDAIRLTDAQLALVMAAARPLGAEKHSVFLERVAGHLRLIGFMRVQDGDVDRAIHAAIRGLLNAPLRSDVRYVEKA
jgi:hypothetical protein